MTESTIPSANMFDNKPLAGQHALVTGGSRGIGASVCDYLARMGANVSLTARNAETLDSHAAALRKDHGTEVFAAAGDMSKEADIVAAFAGAAEALGPVDILVANAGVGKSAPFHRMELDFWQGIIDLNLTGTYLCTKQVYQSMRERGYGRIVNIASTVGLRGYPYIAAYAASKHGVVGLTRSLALEAATTGITVNSVCPGYTDTDLVDEAIDVIVGKTGRDASEVRGEIEHMSPMARMITTEEVAETVAWLCLPSSAAITGQSIVVAGGAVTN
ncbi:MAG: SDR family NAD(P)-dependent oxidoreductase [Rhodospirillales bacterium]|jgi:NAD(P)-dependent dehydrogenase (short-subunit alcohol dehydrogenase family)|nr:SDR family NAD(P)-dependent oxidoreductase [Rhodospirillales bacterium]MDP6644636.1 SDR family NAD(P)-dependent oxidoreductase [Rhodospirillales bacterium]|tara:strand:- start:932 stop:1753 length:822 start_codon:yes stop_codon:yes gene_type:complete